MGNRIVPGAAAALAVVVLAFESGGYLPSEWGIVTLACLLVVVAALVVSDEVRLGRFDVVVLAALALFGAWQLLSIIWSTGAGMPVLEAERTLVYLAAAGALVLSMRPERVRSLLSGVVVGATVVALYALATRLAPGTFGGAYDPSSGYQLAKPIGYWNALGLLLALAIVLAAGLALHGGRAFVAVAAAALVPLVVCLSFTFSRGSIAALAGAIAVLVVLAPDRLRTVAQVALLLAAPAAGVALASLSPALTTPGATLQTAQTQGHRLAWWLVVLSACGACFSATLVPVVARLRISDRLRRPLATVALAGIALVAVVAVAHAGGPRGLSDRLAGSFTAQVPAADRGLERRLLSVSGNGRADYWRVALGMVERDPLFGDGAGAFAARWARERPAAVEARDAHSLYLETLAELGLVGVGLLTVALLAPLLALRRTRHLAPAGPAAAAYTLFLAHAALDWDWEVPLLVLVALACGTSLLCLAPGRAAVRLGVAGRVAAFAGCAVLLASAFVVHMGNTAVGSAAEAIARDDPIAAVAAARRARTWMPWSFEPAQLLGEAELALGEDAAARGSLRRAVALDRGQWSVWFDLALASRGLERGIAITRARELNPRSLEVADLAADISRDT